MILLILLALAALICCCLTASNGRPPLWLSVLILCILALVQYVLPALTGVR